MAKHYIIMYKMLLILYVKMAVSIIIYMCLMFFITI